MANRSETDRAGRGYARQPEALVGSGTRVDSDDAAGGSTEVGSRGSTWERMLEALTSDEEVGTTQDGSLTASIAERLHTRGGSPPNEQGEAPEVRPVRRRRR
jgi:hypothetical protein